MGHGDCFIYAAEDGKIHSQIHSCDSDESPDLGNTIIISDLSWSFQVRGKGAKIIQKYCIGISHKFWKHLSVEFHLGYLYITYTFWEGNSALNNYEINNLKLWLVQKFRNHTYYTK